MDENVNGTETTMAEIVDEMGTQTPPEEETPKTPPAQEAPEEAPAREESGDEPDRKAQIEEALRSLLDDGWTKEELTAFAQDEQVRAAVDGGTGIRKAAKAYLQRGGGASPKKRAVPTMRSAGAGETDAGDPIARMSDKEFDAFYARAMEKAMTGARVRI